MTAPTPPPGDPTPPASGEPTRSANPAPVVMVILAIIGVIHLVIAVSGPIREGNRGWAVALALLIGTPYILVIGLIGRLARGANR